MLTYRAGSNRLSRTVSGRKRRPSESSDDYPSIVAMLNKRRGLSNARLAFSGLSSGVFIVVLTLGRASISAGRRRDCCATRRNQSPPELLTLPDRFPC